MYNLQTTLNRIIELTQNKGLSINQMLKDANLASTIVDNIKRNRIPSVDKIYDLANYFNVSTDYLLGITDNPEVNIAPVPCEKVENLIEIPLSCYSASAGTGNYLFEEAYETIEIDAEIHPKADMAIRIEGNSMEPKYHNNDIVLVRKQNYLENGEIGIFILDDKAFIKKYVVCEDNTRKLVSLNHDYKDIISAYTSKIFGRVLCTL